MPHARVAPVEQDQRAGVPTEVAGVKVAVDDRVRETTALDRGEPAWQVRHERLESPAVAGRELGATALGEFGQCQRERWPTPIGQADLEQFVRPADPGCLQRDESGHHFEEFREAGVISVSTGNVGDQDPVPIVPEKAWHWPALEQSKDVALVGEERRHDLEPGRSRA